MTRPIHEIARDVLTYARSWEPGAKLIGNVTAAEVERLSATIADPWRPIDECGELEAGKYLVLLRDPETGAEWASVASFVVDEWIPGMVTSVYEPHRGPIRGPRG